MNDITATGKTALFAAAEGNDVEMIRLLLRWGADITVEDHYGTTAALTAKKAKAGKAVKALRAAADAPPTAGEGEADDKEAKEPKTKMKTKGEQSQTTRQWVTKDTTKDPADKGALEASSSASAAPTGASSAGIGGGGGAVAFPVTGAIAIGLGGIGVGVGVGIALYLLGNK